ncbi:MAG: hypothetical protein ABSC06_03240 [Rhodopila sp.]|jgi:hypothetical protein
MSIERPIVAGREKIRATRALSPMSEASVYGRNYLIDEGPLDWGVAVSAATVLLNASFGLPVSADDPIVAEMARDLAARLSAYSAVAEPAEDMLAHTRVPPAND